MARFSGKVVVVAGGSGVVGAGIVRAFLSQGATLIAPLRSEAARKRLVEEDLLGVSIERLETPIVALGEEKATEQLAQQVKETHGGLDHLVTSLGAWWQKGLLLDQPLAEFDAQIHNLAASHFVVAKAFVPLLKPSPESSYTIITGGAGNRFLFPGTGLVTVGASTLFGISLVLRGEYESQPQRINELRISAKIERHADAVAGKSTLPGATPISNRAVGQFVTDLAASETKGDVVKGDFESFVNIKVT